MVFARSYYGDLLLGVVLVDARECELPSLDVCLPCDAYISGDSLGVFRVLLVSFGLFRPGAVRALEKSSLERLN